MADIKRQGAGHLAPLARRYLDAITAMSQLHAVPVLPVTSASPAPISGSSENQRAGENRGRDVLAPPAKVAIGPEQA